MSVYFSVGENDVWNPSSSVARLFVAQVSVVSAELGTASGVSDLISDECEIEVEVFANFIEVLLTRYEKSNNLTLRQLVEGVLGIGIALLSRLGRAPEWPNAAAETFWSIRSGMIEKSMPKG